MGKTRLRMLCTFKRANSLIGFNRDVDHQHMYINAGTFLLRKKFKRQQFFPQNHSFFCWKSFRYVSSPFSSNSHTFFEICCCCTFGKLTKTIMLHCFGVSFVPHFLNKAKHWTNMVPHQRRSFICLCNTP